MSDRYLKVVLTVIALELGWIAVKDAAVPLAAQSTPSGAQPAAAPMPVIIRGVDLRGPVTSALPIRELEPLAVITARPVQVDGSVPLRIQADRPIPVENVGYKPGARPGE